MKKGIGEVSLIHVASSPIESRYTVRQHCRRCGALLVETPVSITFRYGRPAKVRPFSERDFFEPGFPVVEDGKQLMALRGPDIPPGIVPCLRASQEVNPCL